MPVSADGQETDNVIHLRLAARKAPPTHPSSPPFLLEARPDGWKLHNGGRELGAEELIAAADLLRDIARSLTEMAGHTAGHKAGRCIAEFVLYESGGIDHWVAQHADHATLRLGLRTAISTIREP
jgi:hypothetical protein